MRHFIIVKFNASVDMQKLVEPIKTLFNHSLDIEGIDEVKVYLSNTDLPNRHDLMIEMLLTKEALKDFDNSEIHKIWKLEYGKDIISKTIFDCD